MNSKNLLKWIELVLPLIFLAIIVAALVFLMTIITSKFEDSGWVEISSPPTHFELICYKYHADGVFCYEPE